MTDREALKRLMQETAPATYMPDAETFKEQCNIVISKSLDRLCKLENFLDKWQEQLKLEGIDSKMMVLNDIQYLKGLRIQNE